MKCFRCNLKIEDKEDYFEFNEFSNKKIVNTDYCHKKCWAEFKKALSDRSEAMGLLRNMKKSLIERGLINEEVEVIV